MITPDKLTLRRATVSPTDIFRGDTDLLEKITTEGFHLPYYDSPQTRVFQLAPSHPHHVIPEAHQVLWFLDRFSDSYLTWDQFVYDTTTLSAIDSKNSASDKANSQYMSYIMLGHGESSRPKDGEPQCRTRGLASKQHPHLHKHYTGIPKTHPDDTYVTIDDKLGHRTLESQSNLAMDLTLSCIAHFISGFGTPLIYTDIIGVTSQKLVFNHVAFGFHNMSSAITATYALTQRSEIKEIWPKVIAQVADHPNNYLPGNTKVRAGFQLNAMVIHPSAKMRHRLRPSQDFDTWVLLASDGGFSFFVENGITIDRGI